jgi:hypothetical protein
MFSGDTQKSSKLIALARRECRPYIFGPSSLFLSAHQCYVPIQEEVTVAESRLGVLIDCNDDRLNVSVTPAFARSQMPNLCERFYPRWLLGLRSYHFVSCIFHQLRPPKTFPLSDQAGSS